MAIKSLLIKNNEYDKVRLTIFGDEDGTEYKYYTEASGNRYYFTSVSSTASTSMQAATFNSFLSFTMSGEVFYEYDMIPMLPGETVMIESRVVGINSTNDKGYIMKAFGGYKHDGTNIEMIGPSIDYDTKSDFTGTLDSYFTASGTTSISMCFMGETASEIDWDIHTHYTKGFHALEAPVDERKKPIYPEEK